MKKIDNNKEDFDLYAALKSFPGIKNLKRYGPGELEKLPLSEQSPVQRRAIIYRNNTKN